MIKSDEYISIRKLGTNGDSLHIEMDIHDKTDAVVRTENISLPFSRDDNPALNHLFLGMLHLIQDEIYTRYGQKASS